MSNVITILPDFKGFAVEYDLSKNPFFKPIVIENLRKIAEVSQGKELLKRIGDASPKSRGDFLSKVNVLIKPYARLLVQSGHKMTFSGRSNEKDLMVESSYSVHSLEGCPFNKIGGSFAQAVDITAAGNSQGTVSIMKFTNAPARTTKGEIMYTFIVLAHELIHSLHHVEGIRMEREEELWTTGLGKYSDEAMSENGFRKAFKLPLRVAYY